MASQPYLDPMNQGFADLAATLPLDELSPEELRESLGKLNEHEKLPGVDRNMIQTPAANGTETWIYTPKGPKAHSRTSSTSTEAVSCISFYDSIATDLVLRTGYAVVFPEYKLAPEAAKWPEQQEQCFEVLEWVIQNGTCHNLVPDKFALMADSAGGLLIFNMNVMAQQKGLPVPYNVLLGPVASLYYRRQPPPSRYECWDGPFLKVALMQWFVDVYAPTGTVDRASELASPSANMSDAVAAQFAPTLIVTSSADVLRDEGKALGERLQRAGRDVAVLRAHGQVHVAAVINMVRGGPTPKMVMTLIVAALKQRLGSVARKHLHKATLAMPSESFTMATSISSVCGLPMRGAYAAAGSAQDAAFVRVRWKQARFAPRAEASVSPDRKVRAQKGPAAVGRGPIPVPPAYRRSPYTILRQRR
ncbi:hypothetical protein PG994_001688 [Apiospora phragmitis]|uniref:Alpha/beta hydrolase fold-3 domain-containing protein n=1 Tax=Apiospora phragmitis TaxID=2905665 RepID=A0ABR1WUB7_9PEZI